MSELDFDDVLSDFDETDTYYSDSDYDPDEDSIECIECDELGNISDIYDIPYTDIAGVADAAVGAGFHLKVNAPKVPAKKKIKPKVKASVKVTAKGNLFPKKVVAAAPAVPANILGPIVSAVAKPNASISSVLQAVAHVKTPVIKPGTKPAEVLKKLAVHPKIQGKVNTDQLKKLAVAMSVKPAVKASVSIPGLSFPGPLGINIPSIPSIPSAIKVALPSIAPIIAPSVPLPLPIAATSPAIPKIEVSMPAQKVEHARAKKKLSKKRPKQSVSFIPPKKHEMVCLGQMVPKRLYDLIIEFHKHKKQKRKERACKCADAVKATEKKLHATGGMAPTHIRRKGKGSAAKRGTKSGIKTISVQPEQYIRIACGLPA